MTNQKAFDTMMAHLRSLQGQSVNGYQNCVYNGSKCAIGRLLTDEEQQEYGNLDGDVSELVAKMKQSGKHSLLFDLDIRFLHDMQSLHDSFKNWFGDVFDNEPRAKEIAENYGLIYR
jgi:hypothetical protein